MAKTYIRGTLKLVIDHDNSATPAMVYAGKHLSSSYDCATNEGCVDDEYNLSHAEQDWLEGFRDRVEEAFEIARKDNPEYN